MEGRFVEMVARQHARGMEGASFDSFSTTTCCARCVRAWVPDLAVSPWAMGIAQGGGEVVLIFFLTEGGCGCSVCFSLWRRRRQNRIRVRDIERWLWC